jgi:hypothetical protein
MTTNEARLHAVDTNSDTTTSPDPFNIDALRISQDFEQATGVRKLLTTIPVRKPHKQEWVRVHPDEAYRGTFGLISLKEEGEFYLVTPNLLRNLPGETIPATIYTAINRQGAPFLWPARLPSPEDRSRTSRWYTSAIEAAELAMKRSVRVTANMSLGAYEIIVADNPIPENDPVWPDLPFAELLRIGFQTMGRFVDSFDHPVIKQLRGA